MKEDGGEFLVEAIQQLAWFFVAHTAAGLVISFFKSSLLKSYKVKALKK